jgi:uncharacterized membrane protein
MPEMAQGKEIEERLAALEARFEELVATQHPGQNDYAVRLRTPKPQSAQGRFPLTTAAPRSHVPPPGRLSPSPRTRPLGDPVTAKRHAGAASSSSWTVRGGSMSDLLGGRVLAWLGGIATLIGIVLFLALAISRGWIGQEARVGLAATLSCALMAAGTWLHSRRGRTEAAKAMVGAATAGLFSTLIVASQAYELIPPMLAVGFSLVVGGLATALAIRWAGRVVGALGLLGALLSPVLVGASMSAETVALLGIASACAAGVTIRQRWTWLGLGSLIVCTPQWAIWLLAGQAASTDVAVLSVFAALGLIGAVGPQVRWTTKRLPRAAIALAAMNACLLAVIGRIVLDDASGKLAAELWLATLASLHAIAGMCRFRRFPISARLRHVLVAIGVILADVAFGVGVSGITLVVGWGFAAIGFAWLVRRTSSQTGSEALLGLGLGAHVALTLMRALVDTPPSALGSGDAQLVALVSVSVLTATCLTSAHLVGRERPQWHSVLNALGLAAIAYLTASALTGPALVGAWCVEALALTRYARASNDAVARYGALGFLGLAIFHALAAEAPPAALVTGVSGLGAAAIALGAIALATWRAAQMQDREVALRRWLLGGSVGALLYLVSVAIVTAFQPGAEASVETVLDLSVRQQGQVLLSALWSAVGLAALIVGLRGSHATVRRVALGWLMVTVGKVFLYDLSILTSIYRVISFIVLGLLLLAGSYAYQRLRPPPPPDMRTVHPSQL